MALTRPTLLNQVAFDATQSQTFVFTVTGTSSQVVANQLIIRKQETNDIVYQEKQETFKYEHIVNADELTNGVYYNATLTVFDAEGNESPSSIPIQFWCYSTPVLTFTNLPMNNIISNTSFDFQFSYTQAENEALNSYVVNLFNASQVQISTSGILYADNGTPPYTGNYTFTGFENNSAYYIQVNGLTVEGTSISTVLQQFSVQYTRPDIFTLMQLNNNCDEGYITITSNIVSIEGESNPSPPTYIDDKEVDLTEEGSWVQWNDEFSITGDMLTRLWFRNPNNYSTIMQMSNTDGQIITLKFMLGYENNSTQDMGAYVEAYIQSVQGLEYYIFSNFVTPLSDTQYYTLFLTRNNSVYQLQLLT